MCLSQLSTHFIKQCINYPHNALITELIASVEVATAINLRVCVCINWTLAQAVSKQHSDNNNFFFFAEQSSQLQQLMTRVYKYTRVLNRERAEIHVYNGIQ